MGNGNLIAEADRGITKKAIIELKKKDWARKQGGICRIINYAESRAVFYTEHFGQRKFLQEKT